MSLKRIDYTDRYRHQYAGWRERADLLHHGFVAKENDVVAWTPFDRELRNARVAIVTTAGVHPKSEEPFDEEALEGDASFRLIPGDIASRELMVTHNHYDHSEADRDINCVFPIDRARELAQEGVIAQVSDYHYGFMGFNPSPEGIVASGRKVAAALASSDVDVVIMVPG